MVARSHKVGQTPELNLQADYTGLLSVGCPTGVYLHPDISSVSGKDHRNLCILKREERKPTRCNNIDDLLSIVDVDY